MRRLAAALLAASLALSVGCQARGARCAYVDGIVSAEVLTEGSWKWSTDAECESCHQLEAESVASILCEALESGRTCATCHNDEPALSSAHALPFDSAAPTRLRSTEADSGSCGECHDAGDLALATAESEILTDTAGTSVNPHALPASENHNEIECLDCHQIHRPDLAASAQEECLDCHHQGIYECHTCHS